MGARQRTLTATEVAVGGRGATLPGRYQVAIYADAHRAARLRPFKAGRPEDAIETLLLRRALDAARSRRDQARYPAHVPGEDGRRGAQVLDAAIGAGTDEDPVNGDVGALLA